MSEWSGGYPTGSAYLESTQTEIAPFRWRAPLLAARRLPPDTSGPFRFLELGCGSAQTLTLLAACYPEATFLGYDFMPEHVARAQLAINASGLKNIRVEEASFAELAAHPPEEKFDFAALHGVWSWVSEAVRGDIVSVLKRWLSPGAVAYFGYNAAAGWAAAEPLRRLFCELPQARGAGRYAVARTAIEAWLQMVPPSGPHALWEKLKDLPDTFLAHELGSPHGTGIWQGDLAAALGDAKMDFACPALLADQFDALFLDESQVGFLRQADAEGWGQTARDLTHGRFFRADLFHRGAPQLGVAEMITQLRAMPVAAWQPELELTGFESALKTPKHSMAPDTLSCLRQAAMGESATIATCMDALGLEPVKAIQAVLVALLSGHLIELRAPGEAEAARDSTARFNSMARDLLIAGSPMHCLASPTVGGAIPLSPERQRVAFGLEPGTPDLDHALSVLGLRQG